MERYPPPGVLEMLLRGVRADEAAATKKKKKKKKTKKKKKKNHKKPEISTTAGQRTPETTLPRVANTEPSIPFFLLLSSVKQKPKRI
jgi:hypothetical protein